MNRQNGRQTLGVLISALATLALAGCTSVNSTLKASAYYDTRGLPTGAITGSLAHANYGTRLYSFANIEPDSAFPKYLEASVTQPLAGRFAGVVEYNRNYNAEEGATRFGVSYRPPLPQAFSGDRLTLKYTPFSTHGRGPQLNSSGAMLFGEDMYLEWFLDYDLRPNEPNQIVTDWQFGRRITGPLYGVVEFRHNSAASEPTGVGIGLEWVFR